MEKLSSTISSQFNAITPIISYDDLIQNGGMSKLLLLDSLIDKNHFKLHFQDIFSHQPPKVLEIHRNLFWNAA